MKIAGFAITKKDVLGPLRTPIPRETPAIICIDGHPVWDGCAMMGSLFGGFDYPSEVIADRVLEAIRGGIFTIDGHPLGPGLIIHKRLYALAVRVLRGQKDGKGIPVTLPKVQMKSIEGCGKGA